MTEYQRVRALLDSYEREAKKSLGQNFLVNEDKINKIIEATEKLMEDSLLEIGPGLGALTRRLIPMEKQLQLIEMDDDWVKHWQEEGQEVHHGDALAMDWGNLQLDRAVLVSNLPYQISSRLVMDRSVNPYGLKAMVLMFQKEVAQRILATPEKKSDYGLLTVVAQSFWRVKTVAHLGPKDFYPAPKVASQVLQFEWNLPEESPWTLEHRTRFLKFVKMAFSQRRKMLKKNIAPWIPVEDGVKLLESKGLKATVRPEELGVAQFQELYWELVTREENGN